MIYLDNAATTRPDFDALLYAQKFNNEFFYNPSALYQGGIDNSKEIKNAKNAILSALGVNDRDFEVVFTSCGSESDNTAIFCAKKRGLFVTTKGEHSAVYKSFLELKQRGITVEFIDLLTDGSVNVDKLVDYVKNNNVDFLSIVHVNNETGAINDVNYIANIVKEINSKIIIHVDGVQAFCKIPYLLSKNIDLYSISAHKINGVKGVGALIKRKNLVISPLIYGGGQENGLRSGTENVFGIKVFEYVTNKHKNTLKEDYDYVKTLKDYSILNLNKDLWTVISSENSSPYILSISARGLRGEIIMHALEEYGIIVGNGSACSSKSRFSRVIEACGYKKDILDGVVRVSFSNQTTQQDVVEAINRLNEIANKLKGIISK